MSKSYDDPIKLVNDLISMVDWKQSRGVLLESLIREFHNKVDWDSICKQQTLSEDFIREFKDDVDWEWIHEHQVLSADFIREFKH